MKLSLHLSYDLGSIIVRCSTHHSGRPDGWQTGLGIQSQGVFIHEVFLEHQQTIVEVLIASAIMVVLSCMLTKVSAFEEEPKLVVCVDSARNWGVVLGVQGIRRGQWRFGWSLRFSGWCSVLFMFGSSNTVIMDCAIFQNGTGDLEMAGTGI